MIEPICAVCGEKDEKKLTMFNYGVCLCHRCLDIAAHSFIKSNAERKLKETEKAKETVDVEGMSKKEYESMTELKDEIAKKLWDEITEKIKKKREADAKKMAEATAKGFEEIGKAIFIETTYHPELYNGKKMLDDAKEQIRHYKTMYRNQLEKFANLMNEYKKLRNEVLSVRDQRDSLSVRFVDAQLDANRYQKRCDELHEEFSTKLKVCNVGMLVASAASLLVGVALGYGLQ